MGEFCSQLSGRADVESLRARVATATGITEFQRRVYLALLDVPAGETITYGELGRRIGCRSAQAIGQALKRNPFAPEVPCHRVVARNGIGGYCGARGGELLEKKRRLLAEEAVSSAQLANDPRHAVAEHAQLAGDPRATGGESLGLSAGDSRLTGGGSRHEEEGE